MFRTTLRQPGFIALGAALAITHARHGICGAPQERRR